MLPLEVPSIANASLPADGKITNFQQLLSHKSLKMDRVLEAYDLITVPYTSETKNLPPYQNILNTTTFGIEFELTIPNKPNLYTEHDFCQILMSRNNLSCRSAQYSDKDVKPYWKIKPDSSILCPLETPSCFAYELVSPVLSGQNGLNQVKSQIVAMQNLKPSADYSSGLHLHTFIGKNFNSPEFLTNLKKILINFIKFEEVFDSIMPLTRQKSINGYCQSIRFNQNLANFDNFPAQLKISQAKNFEELNQLVNPGNGTSFQRHFKINLQPIFTLGTIEWRQHSATVDLEKVESWIRLILLFVRNSINQTYRIKSFKDDTPLEIKFYKFFEWVIRDKKLYEFYLKRQEFFADQAEKTNFLHEKMFISRNNLAKIVTGPGTGSSKKGSKDTAEIDSKELQPCLERYNAMTSPNLVNRLPERSNNMPVIGILTQECPENIGKKTQSHQCSGQNVGYVSTNYIKFVESAGARAYVIPLETKYESLKFLMNCHLSGVILPGGPYTRQKTKFVLLQKWVHEIQNLQKIPIPVLGVCVGYERFILNELGLENRTEMFLDALQAKFKQRIQGLLPAVGTVEFLKDTKSQPALYHSHRWFLNPEIFETSSTISKNFKILTNSTFKELPVVSTVQHQTKPFIGTAWHPEKPAHEFHPLGFPKKYNTPAAIGLSQKLSQHFINLCRAHPNRFRLSKNFLSHRLTRFLPNPKIKYGELVYA